MRADVLFLLRFVCLRPQENTAFLRETTLNNEFVWKKRIGAGGGGGGGFWIYFNLSAARGGGG